MGWTEANAYQRALREVEDELDRRWSRRDDTLPWRATYAEIFGDRTGLLRALARRWLVIVQAQLEPMPGCTLPDLMAAHPGLVAALARHRALLAGPTTVGAA